MDAVEKVKAVIPTWKFIVGVIIAIIVVNAVLDALANIPYVGTVGAFIQKPVTTVKGLFAAKA